MVILKAHIYSFFYRLIRNIIKISAYFIQFISFNDKDLEAIVDFGDRNLILIDKYFGRYVFDYKIPNHIKTEIFGLEFKSPLVAASFKSDDLLMESWFKLGLGAITFKTILDSKRQGNPRPRLQQFRLERSPTIINALGLPGNGIDTFTSTFINSTLWDYDRPIGISIGGENLDEYKSNFDKINSSMTEVGFDNFYFELNISCPNTVTGTCIGDNLLDYDSLMEYIRKKSSAVISTKVSPDWDDKTLNNIGEIIKTYDKSLVNAGNTQYKTLKELGLKSTLIRNGAGGISGTAIFPRTLQMVTLFKRQNVLIMATGGISTIHHVMAAKQAGASLFGMATSLIMDPFCIPKINYGLK